MMQTTTTGITLGCTPAGLATWNPHDPATPHLLIAGTGPGQHMTLLASIRREVRPTLGTAILAHNAAGAAALGAALGLWQRTGKVVVVLLDGDVLDLGSAEAARREQRATARLLGELVDRPGAHIVHVTSRRDALDHMPAEFRVRSTRILLGDAARWRHLLRNLDPGFLPPYEGLLDQPGHPVSQIRL